MLNIPLTEEDEPSPLTQCSLLVNHNLIGSCHNSRKIDAKAFVLECILNHV